MNHNKISFIQEYCRCRRIPYKIKNEALFIGKGVMKKQVCFSVYNLTYNQLIEIVDRSCVYDKYGFYQEIQLMCLR